MEPVENLLQNIEKLSGKKLREKLAEHSDLAVLSKKLAEIKCDVFLDIELEELKITPDKNMLTKMFEQLEFKSLISRIEELLPDESRAVEEAFVPLPEVPVVETAAKLDEMIAEVRQEKIMYFYPVTDGRVPSLQLTGLALAVQGQNYYITPEAADWSKVLELLEDESVSKVTYAAKHIYSACDLAGRKFNGLVFDIMIAAYLINPTMTEYPIELLADIYLKPAGRLLHREMNKDFYGWAAEKCKELYQILKDRLAEYSLTDLYYNIEQPLIEVLSQMELAGIKVDTAKLKSMSYDIGRRIEVLLQEIYELAGCEFNVNSPKQLGVILFETLKLPIIKKTKTGYSTDVEVLESLAGQHALIDKLLEYRMLTKLKSTYLDGLEPLVNALEEKIYTNFNQTVTATGRLSSSEPNLQNIPIRSEIGRKIRELFVPSAGYEVLLSADYSQIELRILAHISQDSNLIDAFLNSQDIHTRTASEVFGVELEQVTSEMRTKAKAVNFGIVYGISDYGLSRDLGVSRKEAAEYIKRYFARYIGIKRFMTEIVSEAKKAGYVSTLYGRRRYLPEINSSNFNQRSFAERTAMNTPIQGTAADIIKKAMVDIYSALREKQLASRILLQVHDELVLEVKVAELAEVTVIVKQAMENALKLLVLLLVESHLGKNWAEAK